VVRLVEQIDPGCGVSSDLLGRRPLPGAPDTLEDAGLTRAPARRAIRFPDPAVIDGLVVAEEPDDLVENAARRTNASGTAFVRAEHGGYRDVGLNPRMKFTAAELDEIRRAFRQRLEATAGAHSMSTAHPLYGST
jgi:hypothetical protein